MQKIYEDSEAIQDDLGELIRTLNEITPETINEILSISTLPDSLAMGNSDLDLLEFVKEGQEHMVDSYMKLQDIADTEGHVDIQNFAQDRIRVHKKFIWMLESTLTS